MVASKSKAVRTDGDVHQVAEVEVCHNDEPEVIDDDWEDSLQFPDSEDEYISNQAEGEGPPQVSSEKLRELDEQAALDELEKLHNMEVIQPVVLTLEEAAQENTVDTTLVFDWRFRGNSWIRRCRVVAWEFRTTNKDENSFSPTPAFSSVRMLLTFALMYGLAVTSLDIKDAFLMVPQVEVMYVEIPQWVRERTGKSETHWLLRRCLPGQRNAALRWHQHFAKICEAAGLRSFPGSPTVLRHENLMRKIYVNVHVDDILLVCKPEEVQWFQDAVGSTLTMKVDGPHLQARGEQLMYLKKRITMREDGILIQPNATYVPKLVAMMKVSGRRKKGWPYHATLETFNAEFAVEFEMLDGEQAGLFRSGLGLTLYMAMHRPDIQFAVKVLSSYMSRPSVKAISALKHLASYLEGTSDDGIPLRTSDDGIPLRSTEEGKMVSDFWKENDFIQDEVTIPDWTAVDGRWKMHFGGTQRFLMG